MRSILTILFIVELAVAGMARQDRAMKNRMIIVLLWLPMMVGAQTYRSNQVFKSWDEQFHSVEGKAWLDYNLDEKYVELIFGDSVYHYEIRKTGKTGNKKRFQVWFKGTADTMLWNVENKEESFFSFKMGEDFFWFKDLHNCSPDEIILAKNALLSR